MGQFEHFTSDTFFHGQVIVTQHKSGYRYSIDSVLLARHADPRPGDTVIDLGTGCGIIPLILAFRHSDLKIYGIEIQKELADIALLNVNDNGFKDRISILAIDMKKLKNSMTNGPADLIICNPPYRKADSGRINPNHQRAVARHEIKVTLDDIIQTARRLLRTAGRFITIYTAGRTTDLLTTMRAADLEPKFARMIHSRSDTEAKMVLVEGAMRGRPGMKIGPPLIIYNEDGSYTEEVDKMFLP